MSAGPAGPTPDDTAELDTWAATGLLELDGADGSVHVPAGALHRITGIGAHIDRLGVGFDREGNTDVLGLLQARSPYTGGHGRGLTSAGGSARILAAARGRLAVNLARPDDLDLLPAWLGEPVPPGEHWAAVAASVAERGATEAADAAQELGLPVAVVGPSDDVALRARHPGPVRPWLVERTAPNRERQAATLVVDFSSLWAGPLCARLLKERAGARVVKVEAVGRPDGARNGPPEFYASLHAGDEAVAVDFRSPEGRRVLHALVAAADVVIEGSRPRALGQIGVTPEVGRASRPHQVWTSITAYGRTGPWSNRVGFGDDTAAAGGLVARSGAGTGFLGDAIADPVAGALAALATLTALAQGGGATIDVALRDAACWVAGGRTPRFVPAVSPG